MRRTIISSVVLVLATAPFAPVQGGGEETMPAITTVRIRAAELAWVKGIAEGFSAARPGIEVVVRPASTFLPACGELATGTADLILLDGGTDDIYQYHYEVERGKLALLSDVFQPGELQTHVLARRGMAIVTHPGNPMESISTDVVRGLMEYAVGRDVPDPLAGRALRYFQDGILCHEMRYRIFDDRSRYTSLLAKPERQFHYIPLRAPLLDEVAANRNILAFQQIHEEVWRSGVKVLPVELPDGRRVLPTAEHIMSGAYPYHCSLILVVPAKASPAVRELAAALLAPEVRRRLRHHWVTGPLHEPGTPRQNIWPPLDAAAGAPAAQPASVAVLPIEQLCGHFRFAGNAVRARYEDDLSAGIARTKTVTLVDRAELRRVLAEHASRLASGDSGQARPIRTADVIVLGHVVSHDMVAHLRVEAFHAGTASCVGVLELPIHPARPNDFEIPLDDLVAAWWPAVMANAVRARPGQIWVLAEETGIAEDPVLVDARAALDKVLAGAEGVFYARPSRVPAAQREVLLWLMGLARPNGEMAMAADYVVALDKAGDRAEVTIRRGADAGEIARRTFAGAECAAWLHAQLERLSPGEKANRHDAAETAPQRPRREDEDGAETAREQARREYERGMALRERLLEFRGAAYDRYRAANRADYFPEDWTRIEELGRQIDRHFARATQLDPTDEAAALEDVRRAVSRTSDMNVATARDAQEALWAFIERHPRSPNLGWVLDRARFVPTLAPPDADPHEHARHSRRRRVNLMAEYMRWFLNRPEERPRHDYQWQRTKDGYLANLDAYAEVATAVELEEALNDYGLACDPHPSEMPHSDFLRLRYMARRGEKQAYVELLAAMQRRWPDPSDEPWRLSGEPAWREMCELFRIDPRRNSLFQWLKGRRGPGDLPYPGYQAPSETSSAPF